MTVYARPVSRAMPLCRQDMARLNATLFLPIALVILWGAASWLSRQIALTAQQSRPEIAATPREVATLMRGIDYDLERIHQIDMYLGTILDLDVRRGFLTERRETLEAIASLQARLPR